MASKSKRRRRVLGASCILAALIVAGSSFAWFTSKDEVTNRLTASTDYGVSIVESFVPPKQWVPGQTINKDVYAVNTGNIDAFVKESISGNLSYTYEKRVATAPENGTDANGKARDAGYVRLDTDSARAIDGATTMEAGGFIAWTNATKTIYKLNGTVVEVGDSKDITEPTTAKDVILDNAAAKKFKYEYTDSNGTYVGDSLEEGAVFYKLTDPVPSATEYTASATDAGNLTLTVDHSPTAGTVNSATQTDANDAANAPGKVEGERWHPTDTGVYIFRRSYVPNNAADADKNAVTYKFNGTEVEESAFKTNTTADKWEVTDDSDSSTKTFKYKYTDGSSNVYYGDDLKNDTVFYKADANGKINSSAVADQVKLVRNQEGYFTYAGYYYVADDTDPVKNEGKYYKIVLGNDDFRAIETDGTGTAKTYIFDVSATQYQLGYPDTIEVDPVTGKIASDSSVAYSFVKEEKVENVTPDLYYHATGGGENGDVAYLQAVYSAKDADGTGNYAQKAAIASAAADAADKARRDYLDAQGKQAAAEATYDNAVGAYNSAKSRYDQAYADWKYAEALSAASKDIIDAAAKRAQAQAAYDEAKDKFDAAYDAVIQVAKDMKGGTDSTRPTTVATPASDQYNYSDLLNFADSDGSAGNPRTDISYNSIFQTKLSDNSATPAVDTLEEVITSTASAPINGTMYNFNNSQYELLRDANAYMNAMKGLWDDTTHTTKSIVGASKELWEALDDFKTLTKTDPAGADVVAAQKLARVEAARKNMKSLLEDYKYLFEGLHTADFSESTLTALVAGGNDFTTQIDAWITRLTNMGNQMSANAPEATAGSLEYNDTHHVKDDDGTTKNHGANIIVADFIEKYKDYVKENADNLPKADTAWAEAVAAYNKAVSATETDGAKKVYTDRIQTQQKKEDPLHSDDTTKVYEKNDYEGLKSSTDGTTIAADTDATWWLTNNNNILVQTYSVMRPTDGNPSLDSYVANTNTGELTPAGKQLWQTIGREGADSMDPDYLGMPTGSAEGLGNYTYYGHSTGTPSGTKDAEYTSSTYAYNKAVIAVTKEDADDDGSEWTSLVQNTRLTTPAYQTVAALKTAMDNAKTPADNATNDYSQAIATTAAAKKDSERAATVSAGAQDAANAAMAADESAIKINILLDDAAENLDWTSALADGAHAQVADFYYNYILGAGETSEKLIDAVELDKSLTARDYKELVFDLNVKLDSAQITYADDQRTITTTAVEANDEFKMNPTVGRESTDGKGIAVTWDGSDSVSPTTTYRVGTNPVTPKKEETAKNVTTGDYAGEYKYSVKVGETTYYGTSLEDGTKFYEFNGDNVKTPVNTVTLNVVE